MSVNDANGINEELFRPYYPFTSRYMGVNGFRMHYVDEGEGDPIVMVHGNPTWSFYYREIIKGLRDSYRCIAPDHIGMGLSEKPGDTRYPYTLARRVEDFGAFIDGLDLPDRFTLMMHDWGGMIGTAWALENPARVRRLVILNTAAFRLMNNKPLPLPLKLVRETLPGAYLTRGFNLFARGATFLGVARPMSPAIADAYCAPYHNWESRISTLRFVQDIPLTPDDRAYRIVANSEKLLKAGAFQHVPAIIFWGLKDFVFDADFLKRWMDYLPQAEVHRFQHAGHYVLEDAGHAILPLLEGWLADNPG